MCQDEFHLYRLKLNHPFSADFVKSPWFSSVVVIIYRFFFAAYCTGFIIYSGFYYGNGNIKWFIYLTNWGYLTVTVYFIAAAIISLVHFLKKRNHEDVEDIQMHGGKLGDAGAEVPNVEVGFLASEDAHAPMAWYYKALWVIHVIAGSGSITITLLYWLLIFGGRTDELDISTHLLNSLFMIADTMLSSLPVRYLHVVYGCLFSACYCLFSVVYWAAGGTNAVGQPYIYSYLNYEEYPGMAAGLVIGCVLLGIPLCHTILFGFYKLRVFVSKRCSRA